MAATFDAPKIFGLSADTFTMSSSFSLPCEIFKEIVFYAYVYIPKTEKFDDPFLDLQVISPPIVASHVCRSWRRTLLSDPTMWTCLSIPEMKRDMLMELLRRSGSSLLSVFTKLKHIDCVELAAYNDTSNVLSILFREIHRFKVLHLGIDYTLDYTFPDRSLQEWIQQVLSSLQQPAPQLQTFCFRHYDHDLGGTIDEGFLSTLFAGDAPRLKNIHHSFSVDLLEINCPLFHDLSELYLSLPFFSILDFSRLLEFLELSPGLKLLFVAMGKEISFVTSWDIVDLPCLQRLILVTRRTLDLVELILEYVQIPSTIKWHINAHYLLEPEHSPSWHRLVSQTHFEFLHVKLTDMRIIRLSIIETGTGPPYTNQFEENCLDYFYEDACDLLKFWNPLLGPIVSSTITRLRLVFEATFLTDMDCTVFSAILGTLNNLEYLTIEHIPESSFDSDVLNPVFVCVSALVPNPEQVGAVEYSRSTKTPVLDPDLDSIFIDSDDAFSTNSGHSSPYSPAITVLSFPCPRLCDLTITMDDLSLDMMCAVMLRMCYTRRQEEGYPFKIYVRCLEMEEEVESIVLGEDDDDIYICYDPTD